MAMPGTIKNLPRWLYQKSSPLTIEKKFFLRHWPWFLRFTRNCFGSQVSQSAQALHQLNQPAITHYQELMGAHFSEFIQTTGQYHLYKQFNPAAINTKISAEIRKKHGVNFQTVDHETIQTNYPEYASPTNGGIYFPDNAHTVDPLGLLKFLQKSHQNSGGISIPAKVLCIDREGKKYRVITQNSNFSCQKLILACGAWTNDLLAPLNHKIPLIAERGYHLEIAEPGIRIKTPFIHQDYGIAVTPMTQGLRFAGTVDFNDCDALPAQDKFDFIAAKAVEMFPGIDTRNARKWYGSRPSTPDSVPIISTLNAEASLVVATGHGHMGMVGAPMTAKIVSELVLGIPSQLDATHFSVQRFRR